MNKIKFENNIISPSKVVCIGRNYIEHIKELDNKIPKNMVIFNKPNTAITNELYFINQNTRFECEICFLINNSKIAGVGAGLDITKADIQKDLKQQGLPWERAKSFDKSAVFGNFVKINKSINNIKMELFVNDKLTQMAKYDKMIYKPQQILDECKSFMSLNDGDIIMSGTPKGVGGYNIGDIFVAKIYDNNSLIIETKWIAKKS
ncbi:MAG: FAA hydrolase family protein [Epsilonproteobacteria bacterium]|nr:MAG: FAA hydrolase family protein [Campylobacterota bacterium]